MYSIEQAIARLKLLNATGVELQPTSLQVAAGTRFPAPPVTKYSGQGTAVPPAAPALRVPEYAPADMELAADISEPPVDLFLDLDALSRKGFLMPNMARAEIAEQFRIVKRPLLSSMEHGLARGGRRSNLIAVTSGMPDEGKTFCAINLAMSMAQEVEKKILLIEADLVRPSLHQVLGINPEAKGLLDVLEGSCSVAESLLHTNIPKLSVMPAGKLRFNSTELLASATMNKLAEELSTRYADRIVIFDTSPVLATTQALVLASVVGQVLLVTAAGKTTRKQLMRSLGVLEGVKNVNVVLNQARGRVSDFCFDAY